MASLSLTTWSDALAGLRAEVGEQGFDMWLRPTRAVAVRDHTLVIEVPNRFVRDWLVEHYGPAIRRCLHQAAGRAVTIDWTISPLPTQAPEPPSIPAGAPKSPVKSSAVGLNPRYTFDTFVIGSSNRFAHAAALAVGTAPARAYNPLFIYGGVGLGKTHLLYAIGHQALQAQPGAKILYLSSEQFTNQLITAIQTRSTVKFRERYRTVDVLLLDDIHFIAGKESTQEEFFHTFNTLYEAHKQIVLCSDRPPKEIRGLEARLVSRFEWGLVTDIQPPDLETRIAICRKKAEGHPATVPDDVVSFIAERVHSNIRELEGALVRVVAYSTLIGQPITLTLAHEVLKDLVLEESKRVSIEVIQQRVADYFEIRPADMKGKRRTKQLVYPRQIAMYLARQLTDASLPAIGEQFGGRDHSTVLYACGKIEEGVRTRPAMKTLIEQLSRTIQG